MGNWQLYPQALEEMGRVCRPSTGRAVLLTHDNRALSQVRRPIALHCTNPIMWYCSRFLFLWELYQNFYYVNKSCGKPFVLYSVPLLELSSITLLCTLGQVKLIISLSSYKEESP